MNWEEIQALQEPRGEAREEEHAARLRLLHLSRRKTVTET